MIEIRELVKTFDGFAALDGASLTVPQVRSTVSWGRTARANPRCCAT